MSALRMTLSKPSLGAQSRAVRAKAQLGGTALRVSLPRSQRRAPARLVTVAAVDTASVSVSHNDRQARPKDIQIMTLIWVNANTDISSY